jgi:hypothetical protein
MVDVYNVYRLAESDTHITYNVIDYITNILFLLQNHASIGKL